jgi:hypothetical protein
VKVVGFPVRIVWMVLFYNLMLFCSLHFIGFIKHVLTSLDSLGVWSNRFRYEGHEELNSDEEMMDLLLDEEWVKVERFLNEKW